MQDCPLKHIPSHLHSLDKEVIPKFFIGEELYYRCDPKECSIPYNKISLYDISHNRNFNDSSNYPKDDVLYNVNPNEDIITIPDKEIITIVIKSLSENNTYESKVISENNPELVVNIKLLHDPVPCMYPHSVFEISLNGEIVTKDNYDTTLNRGGKSYKNLRRDVRQSLTSIIYASTLDNDSETEELIL